MQWGNGNPSGNLILERFPDPNVEHYRITNFTIDKSSCKIDRIKWYWTDSEANCKFLRYYYPHIPFQTNQCAKG